MPLTNGVASTASKNLSATLARAARGIECGARGEARGALLELEAEAHAWLGRFAESEAAGLEAMALLPEGGPGWYQAAGEVANASGTLGRRERLVEVAGALRRAGQGPARAVEVAPSARLARRLLFAGETALARELIGRISTISAEVLACDPTLSARVLYARALEAMFAGDPETYLSLCEAARAAFERGGDLRNETAQRGILGFAHLELGANEEAARVLRETLDAADRMGLPTQVLPERLCLQAPSLQLGPNGLGRDAVASWWAPAAVEGEVHYEHRAARTQAARELRRVRATVGNVVPGVDHEHAVDGGRQERGVVVLHETGLDVRQALAGGAVAEPLDHRLLDVEGQHLAAAPDRAREMAQEVPRTGTEVGDRHPRLDRHERHDLVGPLPRVARRIVPLARLDRRLDEAPAERSVRVRVGGGRGAAAAEEESSEREAEHCGRF